MQNYFNSTWISDLKERALANGESLIEVKSTVG
jgi:hypothetical protein